MTNTSTNSGSVFKRWAAYSYFVGWEDVPAALRDTFRTVRPFSGESLSGYQNRVRAARLSNPGPAGLDDQPAKDSLTIRAGEQNTTDPTDHQASNSGRN